VALFWPNLPFQRLPTGKAERGKAGFNTFAENREGIDFS
jgi:hypothetical protein